MGLEEVKQGLQGELEEKREKILQEAEEEKERLMQEAKEEVETYREQAESEAQERISTLERSEIASTKLRLKKEKLHARKDAVDDVFKEVKEKLISQSPKQREEILQALIGQAEEEIDVGSVRCASKDKKLIDDYEVESDDAIEGGVICESEDENSRVDLTYTTLLQEIREDNLKEVAEKLFS